MSQVHPGRRQFLRITLTAIAASGCTTRPAAWSDDSLVGLRRARFVLLGEVHDNAGQHRERAALLADLLVDKRSSCVVFEQMDRGSDPAIAAAPRDAESIVSAGRLDRKGWGWPLHRPLIEAALAAGAEIRGGDLSPDDARKVVRGGATAVPAELRSLMDRSGWRDADEAATESEIDTGHCGALPRKLWPATALAQRARDAALAEALLQAALNHERVVLIAGNGHVRRDLGVPRYLIGSGVAAAQIVSVGYLEEADPAAPYDVVRVTPAAQREDPCKGFRKP